MALSQEYNRASKELGTLKKARAVAWLTLRAHCKTDKEADNTWAASSEGQRELELTYLLKGLQAEMSATKAHLRVLDVFGTL